MLDKANEKRTGEVDAHLHRADNVRMQDRSRCRNEQIHTLHNIEKDLVLPVFNVLREEVSPVV